MALWLVATPIGTLGDCSPRAREVLASVRVIAAEDTRTTRRLLGALEIPAPELVALHAHNEDAVSARLAERALREDVALVSDAGTPGVSDPGAALVRSAQAAGVEIRSVPGPSALASALAASGISAAPSAFLGFPPRKGRENWVREALARSETLVIYEAPGRVAELVRLFAAFAPLREACLCREISKRHEEIVRAPLPALSQNLESRSEILGECVLVVGPGEALRPETPEVAAEAGIRDVAAALADRWQVSRREVYRALLALEGTLRDSG
jgi:16S rRNA (cytidine1402-2'-O)-methyltransferase